MEKEGKNKSQQLGFVYSHTFGYPHCVYNFKYSSTHRCMADMMEKFIGKKEK